MTSARGPVPLVEVTRRDLLSGLEIVESIHLGHLVAVDGEARITHEVGDAQVVVFPRSALKPLQATLCLEMLDGVGIELSAEEIAVGWASHRAEPAQLAAVRTLLSRAGVTDGEIEAVLTCPRAPTPDDPSAPRSHLAHNCSGKHALFALTAHALGLPTDRASLLAQDGPLQSRVIEGLMGMLGPVDAVGVDGCGAPALAMPLVAVAHAFARLAGDDRFARVRAAGLAHPALIAGHERGRGGTRRPVVDTALLSVGVLAKRGAEGVLAAGWATPDGRRGGIVAKASDGSLRGASTALVAHLEAAGVVAPGAWQESLPQGGGEDAGTVRAARNS
jgi:L-asparaginase II